MGQQDSFNLEQGDVKKLAAQLRGFDVSSSHMKSAKEDWDTYSETMDKHLVTLATIDTALSEVVSDLLTAEERERNAGSHHQCEGYIQPPTTLDSSCLVRPRRV